MKKPFLLCLLIAAFFAITASANASLLDLLLGLKPTPHPVPDGGATLALLGSGVLAIEALRRKLSK